MALRKLATVDREPEPVECVQSSSVIPVWKMRSRLDNLAPFLSAAGQSKLHESRYGSGLVIGTGPIQDQAAEPIL